jgi:hypothetical protein
MLHPKASLKARLERSKSALIGTPSAGSNHAQQDQVIHNPLRPKQISQSGLANRLKVPKRHRKKISSVEH